MNKLQLLSAVTLSMVAANAADVEDNGEPQGGFPLNVEAQQEGDEPQDEDEFEDILDRQDEVPLNPARLVEEEVVDLGEADRVHHEALDAVPANIRPLMQGINLENLDEQDPLVVQGLVDQILRENPQLAHQVQGANLQAPNVQQAQYTLGEIVKIEGISYRWNGYKLFRI
jgi:hypothetical protein